MQAFKMKFLQIGITTLAVACGDSVQPNVPTHVDASVDGGLRDGAALVDQSGDPEKESVAALGTSQASWAFTANTIAELKTLTDFGVVASVAKIEDMAPKATPLRLLTLTIEVQRVLWRDEAIDVPEIISFIYTPNADPATNAADRWILYFQEYEPGRYRSVGPSGWFAISADDVVMPVPDSPIKLPAHTTVDDFATM